VAVRVKGRSDGNGRGERCGREYGAARARRWSRSERASDQECMEQRDAWAGSVGGAEGGKARRATRTEAAGGDGG